MPRSRLDSRILDVTPSNVRADLGSLDASVEVVQFSSSLTDKEYRLVAKALRKHPRARLRAYGSYDGSIKDLDFLRHFPDVRGFHADALYNSLTEISGLAHLRPDLEFLSLGRTRKRLSLAPLDRFRNLKRLAVEGQTKDIEVIGNLRELRSITLRSISLPDLSLLLPLSELRVLDLKLGGTRNLALLPQIGRIEYLELWMVKGLADLSPVAEMAHLEFLFLQALRQVTTLPNMERLHALRRVWLETMKGVDDLAPLATAPALQHIGLVDMRHLQPEALEPLRGIPTLQTLIPGLGSKRKYSAAKTLIDLPEGHGEFQKPAWT